VESTSGNVPLTNELVNLTQNLHLNQDHISKTNTELTLDLLNTSTDVPCHSDGASLVPAAEIQCCPY
jgi:hypothetical protein